MSARDVPHAVWAAVSSIPGPRKSFENCTCDPCKAARAGEDNDEAKAVIADGLWAERGER